MDDKQPVQRGTLVFGHQSESTSTRISTSATTVEQQASVSEQHPMCEFCFQSPSMVLSADEKHRTGPPSMQNHAKRMKDYRKF